MRMFSRRAVGYLVVATSLALPLTGPSLAQSQGQEVAIRDAKQLVESLRSGGYVIVVRHGATFSDRADTDPFNFDNIAKQRNLNAKGKELAKTFGDAIRQVGIPVGEVYTSNFNRAVETAVLAGFKGIEKTTDLTEGGLVAPVLFRLALRRRGSGCGHNLVSLDVGRRQLARRARSETSNLHRSHIRGDGRTLCE